MCAPLYVGLSVVAMAAGRACADPPASRPTDAASPPPASQPRGSLPGPGGSAPPRPTAVLGVRVENALVVECVKMLEAGRADEALRRLRAATQGPGRVRREQLNEVRLGLGLALVRAGQASEARRVLLPLSRLKQEPELSRRAQVLLDVAARIAPNRAATSPLLLPEAWTEALMNSARGHAASVRVGLDHMLADVRKGDWTAAEKHRLQTRDAYDLTLVVNLDDARLMQKDLEAEYARVLGSVVREINVRVAQLLTQTTDLAGAMSSRYDRFSGQLGYLPAEAVLRYNHLVEEAADASALGERLVTEHAQLVAGSDGRLKRDASVRMSRARLPSKRAVFGR